MPRYLAAWDLVNATAPEPMMRLARRVIGDRRALTAVDHDERSGYVQAIATQARTRKAT